MCNCFTAKVSVSNFKVEKSENLENAFYVFTFFDMTKNEKSRVFSDFEKKVFSNTRSAADGSVTGYEVDSTGHVSHVVLVSVCDETSCCIQSGGRREVGVPLWFYPSWALIVFCCNVM